MMWKDESQLKTIKEIYAPNATVGEFNTFVQMGIATGLNPFLREIWLVKYDKSAPAQIFIGRDGYRKVIGRNDQYDGHIVNVVYSNDVWNVDLINGKVEHNPAIKDRGALVGAYCMVYMKNISRPFYVFVEFSEYDKKQSVWKEKPATMIKKVAECQGIRMADSTTQGTYDEDEMPAHKTQESKSLLLNKKLQLNVETIIQDGEIINEETGEVNPSSSSDATDEIFEQAKQKIEGAKSVEDLIQATDYARSITMNEEKRKNLTELYRRKQKELK